MKSNPIFRGRQAAVLMVVSIALAVSVAANIPGAVGEISREGLLHVCVDTEPGHEDYIVCDEQVGGFIDAPYTGSECAEAGLTDRCTIDFIPGARANGVLTLITDDPIPGSVRTREPRSSTASGRAARVPWWRTPSTPASSATGIRWVSTVASWPRSAQSRPRTHP